LSHGELGCFDDAHRLVLFTENLRQRVLEILLRIWRNRAFVFDAQRDTGVEIIVGDDLDQFREMPAVPFADTHDEGVDVLVEGVEESDGLDDHVVGPLDVELHLVPGEGVRERQLGDVERADPFRTLHQVLDEHGEMHPDASHEFADVEARGAGNRALLLDCLAERGLRNAELELSLVEGLYLGARKSERESEKGGASG